MSALAEWLDWVVTTLQAWPRCRHVRILETQQFSEAQFALKVRADLVTGDTLQVRLYHNHAHTDYAYHFIYGQQSLRWDNKEHFPSLSLRIHTTFTLPLVKYKFLHLQATLRMIYPSYCISFQRCRSSPVAE